MKLAGNSYNFLINVFELLKTLYTKRINWDYYASTCDDCDINEKTKIDKVHFLIKVRVGLGTAIGPNSRISYTSIGKFCSLGPNLICGWGIHPLDGISTSPVFYSTLNQAGFTYTKINKIEERKHIEIGNDVFIGANVTILDGVKISDGAVIGAGSVVSKDIPPYAIAAGCPIKIIRYRFSDEIIESLLHIQWWNKNEEVLQKVEKNFFNVTDFIKQV